MLVMTYSLDDLAARVYAHFQVQIQQIDLSLTALFALVPSEQRTWKGVKRKLVKMEARR